MKTKRRAVVLAVGSGGDVVPFESIARALASHGVETTLLAPARYAPHGRAEPFAFDSIGAEDVHASVFGGSDVWHPTRGLAAAWRYYAAAAESGLRRLLGGWDPADTALVSSTFAVAARIAEERHGFANTTVHLSPAVVWSAASPPRWAKASVPPAWPLGARRLAVRCAERLLVDPVIRAALAPVWDAHAIERPTHVFSRWIHSPRRVAYAFPRWFCDAAPDWPAQGRFAGFPMAPLGSARLPQALAGFVEDARPLVVVTAGTAVARFPAWVARAVESALREMCRVVLVGRAPLGIAHADLLAVEHAPFDALLPRARLVVHHAGIGTLAAAMRAGVAQLLVPTAHDQPDNAARAMRLGVAQVLGPAASEVDFGRAIRQALGSGSLRDAVARAQVRMQDAHASAARIARWALYVPCREQAGVQPAMA